MKRNIPLSVNEIMKIMNAPESNEKSLALLILTTGIHPKCIQYWGKQYNIEYSDKYIVWKRTKTKKRIMISWRAPMLDQKRYQCLTYWKGQSRQWMWEQLHDVFGPKIKVNGLGPLLLRRAYFINRGRLNHSPMLIEAEAQTAWSTIVKYYAVGMTEHSKLTEEEINYLKQMYE